MNDQPATQTTRPRWPESPPIGTTIEIVDDPLVPNLNPELNFGDGYQAEVVESLPNGLIIIEYAGKPVSLYAGHWRLTGQEHEGGSQ